MDGEDCVEVGFPLSLRNFWGEPRIIGFTDLQSDRDLDVV